MAAQLLGLFPDKRDLIMHGRSQLCESIAVNFSLLAEHTDVTTMKTSLTVIAQRNKDIRSLGVRRANGEFVFQIGDHAQNWLDAPQGHSTETHMYVPVTRQGEKWGTIEVCFQSINAPGIASHPFLLLVLFMSASSMLVFYWYLSKVLRQLNPSNVVPSRVRNALDTLAEGLLVLDPKGRIVLANSAFSSTTGRSLDSLMGRFADELDWTSEDENTGEIALAKSQPWTNVLQDGQARRGQLMGLQTQKGKTFVVNAAPINDNNGKQRGCITSFEDVTKLQLKKAELVQMLQTLRQSADKIRKQNHELERLATRDPLTGCFNRRSFFDHFEAFWAEANRHQENLACVMVDIDHFKAINDTHGHAMGDDVLRKVADCLKKSVRDYDILARFGGEEFSIIMPRTSMDDAVHVAERIRKDLESLKFPKVKITASLGVSGTLLNPASPQDLLEQADQCLYVAKRLGRNQVVRFDEMPVEMAENADIDRAGKEHATQHQSASIPFPAVTALISAMGYRDIETASHSRRVANLCVAVGQGLMSLSSCHVLETAALLHDIGKIGVPDSILLKRTMLTAEEWEVMRQHDRIGVEIIRASFGSEELSGIVENYRRHFSERTLSGDPIPLGARILAIADAFDSMTTDRSYRKGRTTEVAFAELIRCSGTQFDGEIVGRFIEAVKIQQRQAPQPKVGRETILGIGLELERLASAVDQQDLTGLKAMASRLAETSYKQGAPEIAGKAIELEKLVSANTDMLGILKSANQLLELCRATQDSFLGTMHSDDAQAAQLESVQ